MISPGRLWYLLRRDLRRGWNASFHERSTLPRIVEWSWPYWGEKPHPVPVHVLTGAGDWRLAAWMLASFFEATGIGWSVVIHDDGSLPPEGNTALRRLFPDCRMIHRPEADAVVAPSLRAFPFCEEYRRTHPLALKIFDMAQFVSGNRFIVLDSDVLFFQKPTELLAWADGDRAECWFNEDVAEGALLTGAEARDELGVKLWSRVNSGLCLLWKDAIDLDFCDRALAQTAILQGHVWRIEQTLFALCASRHGAGGLLPRRYEVSLRKHAAPDAVARHYVGAVRDRFYGEGLRRLHRPLLGSGK